MLHEMSVLLAITNTDLMIGPQKKRALPAFIRPIGGFDECRGG